MANRFALPNVPAHGAEISKAPETYKQQMTDSDTVFNAVSAGAFNNFRQAEQAVAMLYIVDRSFSRAGISHALKRLEKYYAATEDGNERKT